MKQIHAPVHSIFLNPQLRFPLLFICTLFLSGCIENSEDALYHVELENSAQLLRYIESSGDFANSNDAPGLITAAELNARRAEFVIADIRDTAQYSKGHIAGAIPLVPSLLSSFCDSLREAGFQRKVILVCADGHASAYFTCLLRVAGFPFTYCLKYGMASWNSAFAENWLRAINVNADLVASFVNTNFEKNAFSPLPRIQFPANGKSIAEQCRARAREIIARGFTLNQEYVFDLPVVQGGGSYIVCYGNPLLYLGPQNTGGHPAGTRMYLGQPYYEFRSTNFLQTLPADTPVVLYTSNGIMGACMAAHLRLLGYDAKALLYGANQLFHYRLLTIDALKDDAFGTKDIMNYPYVKGAR